jgi:hypothetical protein
MDGVYIAKIAKRKQERMFSVNDNTMSRRHLMFGHHQPDSLLGDDTCQPKVLYFDYVFVSDKKMYEKFDKSTKNVTADTIQEVAMMNAILLIGNRFSPQIQFRIATHIIWTDDTPSQFDSANMIRFAGLFAPDGDIFLVNFHKWVLETTYFNVTGWLASGVAKKRGNFTEYLVTGHNKELGDRADGWHLLTGYDELLRINKKSETSSHQVVRGLPRLTECVLIIKLVVKRRFLNSIMTVRWRTWEPTGVLQNGVLTTRNWGKTVYVIPTSQLALRARGARIMAGAAVSPSRTSWATISASITCTTTIEWTNILVISTVAWIVNLIMVRRSWASQIVALQYRGVNAQWISFVLTF